VFSPVFSIPEHRVSAWVAETDPKYASAWLAALPLANSAESAREIYQALYTVNRLELRLGNRLELMALYTGAIATVCQGLQPHLLHEVPPLGPKKRQLAEFIRRLHIEMAYGYKCCLRDLGRTRLSLRRKSRSANCIERALYHLSEVLLRSYVVYLPYPSGAWREIHELYRLAESLGIVDGSVAGVPEDPDPARVHERFRLRSPRGGRAGGNERVDDRPVGSHRAGGVVDRTVDEDRTSAQRVGVGLRLAHVAAHRTDLRPAKLAAFLVRPAEAGDVVAGPPERPRA